MQTVVSDRSVKVIVVAYAVAVAQYSGESATVDRFDTLDERVETVVVMARA